MTLRALFPRYPLILVSTRGSRIKFGTHKLYVDFPWQAWIFMEIMMKRSEEADLSAEEIKEDWHDFLKDNKQILIFHNKPLASVYLWDAPFKSKNKKSLVLRVNWGLFLDYLEVKAHNLALDTERDGRNVVKLYGEIWENFFSLFRELEAPESAYFNERENFRKLLKRTGDYAYLKDLLIRFERTIRQVDEYTENKNIPTARLYTANILMNIHHLHALIDIISIPPAYLLMRNVLENITKFFVYLRLGEQLEGSDFILGTMFLYEYESDEEKHKYSLKKFKNEKKRKYSLKKFKKEFITKFPKVKGTSSSDAEIDASAVMRKFNETGIPILGVNLKVLEDFSLNYSLTGANLDKLYSACSEVIHNQPPLPFFSLLEIKFFKHFLENYVSAMQVLVEKIIGRELEFPEITPKTYFEEKSILPECLDVADSLSTQHNAEIKDLIERAVITLQEVRNAHSEYFINPLTLISLFHLISPSRHHLREFSFVDEDMGDIIERLQPLSFRFALKNEIAATLAKLEEMISPELERYSVFSSLSPEKKKKVIFYLLIDNLPRVFEESLRS